MSARKCGPCDFPKLQVNARLPPSQPTGLGAAASFGHLTPPPHPSETLLASLAASSAPFPVGAGGSPYTSGMYGTIHVGYGSL